MKLDKQGTGFVDLNEIKDAYNVEMHPDVRDRKKQEDEVMMEFLETFETAS